MRLIEKLVRSVKRRPVLYRIWQRIRALGGRARPATTPAALRRHAESALTEDRSYAGEGAHLRAVLARCAIDGGTVVDIAAGDGVTQSCTLPLFRDPAWGGLAVEMDPDRSALLEYAYRPFEGVRVARRRVTPDNVEGLLSEYGIDERFEVLNLDLDSYDLAVMEALLRAFRPAVITMEINEKIPPPVYFAVRWDPAHVWRGDHFYGCSLTAAAGLLRPAGYVLEALVCNNAFFVRDDIAAEHGITDRDVAEAYARGYRDWPDRAELFPWNHDVDHLLHLGPEAVVRDLTARFAAYAGRFELRIGSAGDPDPTSAAGQAPGTPAPPA